MGRFLNADNYVSTSALLGSNMFAYCANNPVSYLDPTGLDGVYFADYILYALSSALYSLVAGASSAIASIEAAISSAIVPIVCIAAVSVAIVSIIYLVDTMSDLYDMATEVIAGVKAQLAAKQISEEELRGYTVYVIAYKGTTDVVYVGMTKNFSSRQYYHQRRQGAIYSIDEYDMVPVATGLTYEQARALEQTIITAYTLDALDNMINSIAAKNMSKFQKAFDQMSSLIISCYDPE